MNLKKLNIDSNHLPVLETFYSLQGEGLHTGLASFFIRLGGCDLSCWFCDSKESWNPNINKLTTPSELLAEAQKYNANHIVLTGGEPILYPIEQLIHLFHTNDYFIHLETAATAPLVEDLDWICVSPKNHSYFYEEWFKQANELKVIITDIEDFAFAEDCSKIVSQGCYLFLQPEWSRSKVLLPPIINYIFKNPKWRLSIQTHKYLNLR